MTAYPLYNYNTTLKEKPHTSHNTKDRIDCKFVHPKFDDNFFF